MVASTAEGGVGLVVRDSVGAFVAGKALHFDNIYYATQVEAIAAREGAILAVERGFTNYIIESDSLQIVSALRTTTTDRYVISPIVEDTKSLLSPIIGDVITHICRTANRVADRMARFARNIGTVATWFEEPPDFIIDLLFDDCN
ncbi:PREDICTED: reverse mRNAase [Prunus dulcis]|uniref:PREDICTED: reverse mRNAase n=1 Tax=Prunus dulcis TaxID=3755 RepID=A0A5E4FDM3_PRUDU|nr:PREDICTED: reverse mRNAase [Prunus dulcis]